MQRVAIFKFNWGQRLALSLLFVVSIFVGALFIYNIHSTHAVSDTTYKTETPDNLIKKVKAIKYFNALTYCTSSSSAGKFKTTISGSDIDKGPRWWINGGGTVLLGQYIDAWGNKDGVTDCNGESDDSPGWINDMFSVFGLSTASGSSGKVDALEGLGYDCAKNGSDWSCTNNNINSSTSKKGLLYQALHGPYLNGVNPLTTQPDFNAMSYVVAMNALTTSSMCKATKGGSSNLVTVSSVQADGSVSKADWSVQNDGGPGRRVPAGLPLDEVASFRGGSITNNITCQGAADDTVSFSSDYQKWIAGPACAAAYPQKADDASFITGCTYGRMHPTDYAACLSNTFTTNRAVDTAAQDACFIGQGLPVDASGTPSGRLCADIPKYGANTSLLTACIKGSMNRTVAYCQSNYPAPDQIPNRPVQPDTNAATREACTFGALLKVSGGGIPQDSNILADPSSNKDSGTSCGVDGIGWIVCPVVSFMGDLLANAFSGLADNFLATDTGLFDTSSGTYLAWTVFRNFANIAFVIVFLIIIFSQLTGVGVSNYGVKKLLPRIVIAAILVNLSYFICQVAVDLSNILGYSLKQVFDGIAVTASVPTSTDASANGFGIAAIIVGVIATATVAYFALSILIPILLGALVGVLMVVLMLIARKAIIILLIVLSPLAFVAFLLPNTESLFTKWRKIFMALLLLFPIVSVVFGVSSLASQIVLKAGPGSGSQIILQIMAVGIASLPFFLVPTLLKGTLNGIGSVGGKLNAFASKAGGGLGKAGSKGFANTALARGRALRQQSRVAYRNEKFAKSVAKGGIRAAFAKGANITGAQKYANEALERNAAATSEKADAEEVKAATLVAKTRATEQGANGMAYAESQFKAALAKGDSIQARAHYSTLTSMGQAGVETARKAMAETNDPSTGKRAIDSDKNIGLSNALKQHIINNHPETKGTDNRLMGWATDDANAKIDGNTHLNSLTDTQIASQTADSINAGTIDPTRARRILDDVTISPNIKDSQRQALEKKAAGAPSNKPPAGPSNGGSPPPSGYTPQDNGFLVPHK